MPNDPQDLLQHNCLVYSADPSQHHWPLLVNKKIETIEVDGSLTSNNSNMIVNALLKNQGIARLPAYVLIKAIAAKKVKILFDEKTKAVLPLYAIYSSNITIPFILLVP